jgi:hypothetical protein
MTATAPILPSAVVRAACDDATMTATAPILQSAVVKAACDDATPVLPSAVVRAAYATTMQRYYNQQCGE